MGKKYTAKGTIGNWHEYIQTIKPEENQEAYKEQFEEYQIKALLNKPVEVMDFSSILRKIFDSQEK